MYNSSKTAKNQNPQKSNLTIIQQNPPT